MPFIGNKPSAVPLTSADIADSIITSAKIVDGTIANADINSSAAIALSKLSTTGTASSSNYLRGDGAWTAVSSDYVLLATTDASSSASVSFDGYFSSTYKNYKLIISNLLPATNATFLSLRVRISNADKTDSYYTGVISGSSRASGTGDFQKNDTWNNTSFRVQIADLVNNDNLSTYNGEFTFHNPFETSYKKVITFQETHNDNTNYFAGQGGGVYWGSNSALSGFTFFMSSGNISVGNFKLYGIK
jgi:hypothetical protein